MKKLLYLIATFLYLASIVSPVAAISPIVVGYEKEPPLPLPDASTPQLFLPLVITPHQFYAVSGQVKDAYDNTLSGVTISSDTGQTTTTDENGVYLMQVWDGERQLSASATGYDFDPSPAWLHLDQDMYNVNFSSGAACTTPLPNPSFEIVPLYWNPISGSANGYTPYYAEYDQAHTGVVSGFTGIKDLWPNKVSWSRWRSHEITIPSNATSATLSFYFWPKTTETILTPELDIPIPAGFKMDYPDLPDANDIQYMSLITPSNINIATLIAVRRNDQAWLPSGSLSLMPWRGQTVKLEFGTYNDGWDGVTSTYFDDVVVEICKPDVPGPGCSNLLVNSNFETGTGWTISPAPNPSEYTTSLYFSPIHSMRSGFPIGTPYPAPGEWRIAEFVQNVTIPVNAYYAQLKVRLLPRSANLWGYHIEEQAALEALDKLKAPDRVVSQYGHVRDSTNTYTLKQLFKWFPIHSAYWLYREFNLMEFQGQTVGLLFGAMDDGYGGNTSLYVDDAYLYVCVP